MSLIFSFMDYFKLQRCIPCTLLNFIYILLNLQNKLVKESYPLYASFITF